MKKYIVLSVNDNPDYLYYAPLTIWAWRKFGWEVIMMYRGEPMTELFKLSLFALDNRKMAILPSIEGYRDDTVTQISRLYAGSFCWDNPMVMAGDIDMIPLSDYWKPRDNEITVYGHDLTSYTHYPICYIAMKSEKWCEIMNLPNDNQCMKYIKRDLDSLPQAKNADFYKYWFSDQDLITKRLNDYGKDKLTLINRGQYSNGYAVGRVDRGDWKLEHEQFIDAHLLRDIYKKPENLEKTIQLLNKCFPNDNFDWFIEYTNQYSKLVKEIYE